MDQLIFDFNNKSYPSFDKFLGTENAELLHILKQQCNQFIYLWGQTDSGKSHLLKSWAAQALRSSRKAIYIDAVNQDLDDSILDYEYLAIDQVDKLNDEGQKILFSVFNHFRNNNRGCLLLSGGFPPQQLKIREDLRTRIGYCLIYDVKLLSDQEKIDTLIDIANEKQLIIDKEIFDYLLNHWYRDMNKLLQLLDDLDNYAVAVGKKITLPLLKKYLKECDVCY